MRVVCFVVMTPLLEKKEQAILLREKGHSLREISMQLSIAKSTASLWLRKTDLNELAKQRLRINSINARAKALKTLYRKRERLKKHMQQVVSDELSKVIITPELSKLLCSIFIWTEGGKLSCNNVSITNSDPAMISTFLMLFRTAFRLNENKFRALIHIHVYHNDDQIKEYWSKITCIPLKQFNKSYRKANTGKTIREGYKGCIRVAYYDAKIALELGMFYNTFATGGVVQW